MAEKKQFLDVWIVEGESVYKDVPFTVAIDWIQQGRLLEEDQVRVAGTKDWHAVIDTPALVPYLPVVEPLQAQDMAEALETVELDFHWKRTHQEEDDEVDMIPLIDVSMVLLVFFILTGSSDGVSALIPTPPASHAPIGNTAGVWVGVNLEGEGKNRMVYYSLGEDGKQSPDPEDHHLNTRDEMLTRLDALLAKKAGPVEVTINANKDCEDGLIKDLTIELSKEPRRKKISAKYTGVTEKVQ